ncbi:M48 family metallopeptidase [Thiocapsa bogorovii]|nr:DUF45 domain-containing protein [Thiocapsa bogorovii]UHD16813.1 M48 family metallopeptidase [Thiocapsa bogorovii]
MTDRIQLGDIAVDVIFKDIKHVHLSVYPPDGRVRLAAPAHMSLETLRVFAVSKLGWIRTQQKSFMRRHGKRHARFWSARATIFGAGVTC